MVLVKSPAHIEVSNKKLAVTFVDEKGSWKVIQVQQQQLIAEICWTEQR